MEEKLTAPADFLTSGVARPAQRDLLTPLHFTHYPKSAPSAAMAEQSPRRINPGQTTSVGPGHNNPWIAIAEAKQEILELRRENQRMTQLHGSLSGGQNLPEPVMTRSRSGTESMQSCSIRMETEWRLEIERLKAEVERLRGQLEALKEASGRQREEIRDRDSALNRQSSELQKVHSELCRTKTELGQSLAELNHNRSEQDRLSLELKKLKMERREERERLEEQLERSRMEAHAMKTEREFERQEKDAAGKLEMLRIKEEFSEAQKKWKSELLELSTMHQTEVSVLKEACSDLQDKLNSSRLEVVRLETSLRQACEDQERLREELSKLGNAFDVQSATLQSLRNYIGQVTPGKCEEEKLAVVEKLEKQKESLQVTVDLLTVRLNSLNEILEMQEKEMEEKISLDPLSKDSYKGHKVLHCWREKVFALLVQLRSKDIQQRAEKHKLVTTISTLREELKQQTCQTSVLQHSLLDKNAELDLERVGKRSVEQELAQIQDENVKLRESGHEARAAFKKVLDDMTRFSLVFEARGTEVRTALSHLFTLGQRLTFAKSRVDTIQGLLMRKEALRKVQFSMKQAQPCTARSSSNNLEAELACMSAERDRLIQELKRTPSLIEAALSEAHQQFESDLRQLKAAQQQSRGEAAESGRRLQEAQRELEELTESIAQLRAELSSQEEQSARVLKEKLSETESQNAQQFREMEARLNAARREHTKAVVTLRQFERQAERERERDREIQSILNHQVKKETHDLQRRLQETDRDRNLLLATIREHGLLKQYKKARTAALKTSTALAEEPTRIGHAFTADTPPLTKDSLLCVLGDLQALSAAVTKDSDGSGEEDSHTPAPS
ncbi:coiled-coil alpha-helical rod protein 1 isoform X2 [Brienomyrus brachyistius]|uniref:coiled-coil alpha-helical rod protein 1 isoform X2 n=1 Tax=Brienomyrus brachyistius TaxID=42636 RepID=UPI0020B35AA9|nr:coiled-coil alpha-helical rod protein 1 isoform X2 [Brienomyrus brachyistius]